MNTVFLNWYRGLVNERRRALVVVQAFCLLVVASTFLVAPVVMAGCGKNKAANDANAIKKQSVNAKFSINGVLLGVDPKSTDKAVNAALIPVAPTAQSLLIDPNVTLSKLQDGKWITATYKVDSNPQNNITFLGQIFSRTLVKNAATNKVEKTGELWVAEINIKGANGKDDPTLLANAKKAGIIPGAKFKFASLASVPN